MKRRDSRRGGIVDKEHSKRLVETLLQKHLPFSQGYTYAVTITPLTLSASCK